MRDRVTVIPEDKYIAVDGAGLIFMTAFPADENIHAIQWKAGKGDMELKDPVELEDSPGMHIRNMAFTDYEVVRPFVEMFEAEQLRLEVERQEADQREADRQQYEETHDYIQETNVWVPNLEKARDALCRKVDLIRESHIAGGVSFNFADGGIATIQTRGEKDVRNIMTNGMKALALVSSGQPNTPMQFRTQDDVVRQMTALEMLAMTDKVGEVGQYFYGISWLHKDKINGKIEHNGVLLDTFEKVVAYDYEAGWE